MSHDARVGDWRTRLLRLTSLGMADDKSPDATPEGAPTTSDATKAEPKADEVKPEAKTEAKPEEPKADVKTDAKTGMEKPVVYCRDRAWSVVHKYALFGTAFAAIPIPIATSPALTALETHLIYWIGRIYDDAPSHGETLMIASGLEMASLGLKTVAREAAGLVPVVGWGIKAAIAGASIEALGALIIRHFEQKHPNKVVTATP